ARPAGWCAWKESTSPLAWARRIFGTIVQIASSGLDPVIPERAGSALAGDAPPEGLRGILAGDGAESGQPVTRPRLEVRLQPRPGEELLQEDRPLAWHLAGQVALDRPPETAPRPGHRARGRGRGAQIR